MALRRRGADPEPGWAPCDPQHAAGSEAQREHFPVNGEMSAAAVLAARHPDYRLVQCRQPLACHVQALFAAREDERMAVTDRLIQGRLCLLVLTAKLLLPRRVPHFGNHPPRHLELCTELANALEQVAYLARTLGARCPLSGTMALVAFRFDGGWCE